MFNVGFSELILVLLIAFLVIGPKDLPKVARWLGRMVKRTKRLMREVQNELGWTELEKEFNSVSSEIRQSVKDGDITKELRGVSEELEKNVNDSKAETETK